MKAKGTRNCTKRVTIPTVLRAGPLGQLPYTKHLPFTTIVVVILKELYTIGNTQTVMIQSRQSHVILTQDVVGSTMVI